MCKSQHQQPFDQLDKLAAEFLREENFKYAALCYEKQIEENPYNFWLNHFYFLMTR